MYENLDSAHFVLDHQNNLTEPPGLIYFAVPLTVHSCIPSLLKVLEYLYAEKLF